MGFRSRPIAVLLPAALLAAAACAPRAEVYPGTDVMEVAGFDLVTGRDLEMVGTQLRAGELVYTGSRDVREAFHDYMGSMARRGWTRTSSHVTRDRAQGTLWKDNRTATVEFVALREDVTQATIKISHALLD
jgi:hypothetical protein